MSKQQSQRDPTSRAGEGGGAQEVLSKASELAHQTADKAKEGASYATQTVTHQMKEMLGRQVNSGARTVSHVATSVRRAADDLDREVPYVAGLVRTAADRMEGYADDVRDQSIDQLLDRATELARRQPALVFGLAALTGFIAFRTLKSTPSQSSRRTQRVDPGHLH